MIRITSGLAVTAVILLSCSSADEKATSANQAPGVTEVGAFVVVPTALDNEINTHGSILPNESIELKSEIAGKVTDIYFEEGAFVKKGALLVQMDASELLPLLEKSKAELEIAREELKRNQELFNVKGISKSVLETAGLRVATLESDVRLTGARINKLRITAPFDGVIGLRTISRGAYIDAGERIASLVQINPLKLEFNVSETYAGQIHEGTPIEFTVAGGGGDVRKATVYAHEPAIDPATRSLRVRALAENKEGDLIPGAFAEMTVRLNKIENGLLVPAIAVTQDITGQKVFVIRDGKAVSRSVETGIQKDELVQITRGVEAGDTVITTALLSMREGMAVKASQIEKSH